MCSADAYVVTGIALTILEYTPEPYTYIGIIFGLSIVFLGLTLIGYTNAATLLNNKMKHTLYCKRPLNTPYEFVL